MYLGPLMQHPIVEFRQHRKGDIIHLDKYDFICDGRQYSSLSNMGGGFIGWDDFKKKKPVARFATKKEWEAFFEEPYPGLEA